MAADEASRYSTDAFRTIIDKDKLVLSIMSSSSAGVAENELRDLSSEDAEELIAFLEKRRWFESRLKVRRACMTCKVELSA